MKCERCVFRAEQESAVPRGHIWFSRAARLSQSLSRSLTMCPPYLGFAFLTLLNYSTLLLGLVIALVINLNGYELQVHVPPRCYLVPINHSPAGGDGIACRDLPIAAYYMHLYGRPT